MQISSFNSSTVSRAEITSAPSHKTIELPVAGIRNTNLNITSQPAASADCAPIANPNSVTNISGLPDLCKPSLFMAESSTEEMRGYKEALKESVNLVLINLQKGKSSPDNKQNEYFNKAKETWKIALAQMKMAYQAGQDAECFITATGKMTTVTKPWSALSELKSFLSEQNLHQSLLSATPELQKTCWTLTTQCKQYQLQTPEASKSIKAAQQKITSDINKINGEMKDILNQISKYDRENFLDRPSTPITNELARQKSVYDFSTLRRGSEVTLAGLIKNPSSASLAEFPHQKNCRSASNPEIQFNLQASPAKLVRAFPQLLRKALSTSTLALQSKFTGGLNNLNQSIAQKPPLTMGEAMAGARRFFAATTGASSKIAYVHAELIKEGFDKLPLIEKNIKILVERENLAAKTGPNNNLPDWVADKATPLRYTTATYICHFVKGNHHRYGSTSGLREYQEANSTPFL